MTAVRRVLGAAVVLAVLGAGLWFGRDATAGGPATFGALPPSGMPVEPRPESLSSTWYCPGLPAAAGGAVTSVVAILNPGDTDLAATVTGYPAGGAAVTTNVVLKARSRTPVDPATLAPAAVTGIVVEVLGGGVVTEQTVRGPEGASASPCSSTASGTWYLADGTTSVDAAYDLAVLNPFPDDAVLDVRFVTEEGRRAPLALQGFVVPAGSVRSIPIGEAGPRRNLRVAVTAVARTGRVVVGRNLAFTGAGLHRGRIANLAVPALATTWVFPDGEIGPGIGERVTISNPGTERAELDVSIALDDPSAAPVTPVPVSVGPDGAEVVDLTTIAGVEGRHSITVVSRNGVGVVAERTVDLGEGSGRSGTTIMPGAPLAATVWTVGEGRTVGAQDELAIANPFAAPATVDVAILGIGGPRPLAGATGLVIAGGAALALPLGTLAPSSGDVAVQVRSTGPVVVERSVAAPGAPGASRALAIPAAAGATVLPVAGATVPDPEVTVPDDVAPDPSAAEHGSTEPVTSVTSAPPSS